MAIAISGPVVITQLGKYILTADINVSSGDAIVIQSDNVSIDLNGFTISGSTNALDQSAAIRSTGFSRITVENGKIDGFAYGVYLADLNPTGTYALKANSLVQDLEVTNSTYRGIKVEGSGNVVRNNDISHIGGATFITDAYAMGIETYGNDGLIVGNIIDDVRGRGTADIGEGIGICLSQFTSGTSVVNNTITQPSRDVDANYSNWPAESRSTYGIFVGGDPDDVTVRNNDLTNYFFGITYGRSASGTYGGNDVSGSFIPYYLLANDGIRILDGGANTSDINSTTLAYGRFSTGAVETVEADYLSHLMRIPGPDQFNPIRNPTAGNEVITGTAGTDLVDYWLSFYFPNTTGVTVDLQAGTATGRGGTDTLVSIEGAKGTINNDLLYGSTASNLLDGSWGNDTIFGRDGNDFLFGDDGNDELFGGLGADLLNGGNGIDFARYDDASYGNLTISLQVSSLNTGSAAGDTFVSIEGVIGGEGNDTIYGDSAANYIYGMGGNDMIFGSLGADYLDGGAGFDYARYDDAGYAGLIADLSNTVAGSGAAQGDTFVNFEGLFLTNNNDYGYGNEGNNYLYGLNGNDTLNGRGGADFLYGGNGNDTLAGGDGADTLIGGAGNDILTGGAQWDCFVFAPTSGNDRITDFSGGTGATDRIDLRDYHYTTFSQVMALSYQSGSDLVIQFDPSNNIVIEQFYRGNFAADDVWI